MCCVKRTTLKIKSTINFACSHITKQWPTGIPSRLPRLRQPTVGGAGKHTAIGIFIACSTRRMRNISACLARRFLWPLLTYTPNHLTATYKMPLNEIKYAECKTDIFETSMRLCKGLHIDWHFYQIFLTFMPKCAPRFDSPPKWFIGPPARFMGDPFP